MERVKAEEGRAAKEDAVEDGSKDALRMCERVDVRESIVRIVEDVKKRGRCGVRNVGWARIVGSDGLTYIQRMCLFLVSLFYSVLIAPVWCVGIVIVVVWLLLGWKFVLFCSVCERQSSSIGV